MTIPFSAAAVMSAVLFVSSRVLSSGGSPTITTNLSLPMALSGSRIVVINALFLSHFNGLVQFIVEISAVYRVALTSFERSKVRWRSLLYWRNLSVISSVGVLWDVATD